MGFGGFSWKRATGVSGAKAKLSRSIGVPLTKGGRQRKLGAMLGGNVLGAAVKGRKKRSSNNDDYDEDDIIEDDDVESGETSTVEKGCCLFVFVSAIALVIAILWWIIA